MILLSHTSLNGCVRSTVFTVEFTLLFNLGNNSVVCTKRDLRLQANAIASYFLYLIPSFFLDETHGNLHGEILGGLLSWWSRCRPT